MLSNLFALSLFVLFLSPSNGAVVGRINLTPTGPSVSRIAWGTLHLLDLKSASNVLDLLETALSLGITTVDLSDVYGGYDSKCMKLFGEALALKPTIRSQIEIVAKMDVVSGGYDTSTQHLEEVLNSYLTNLHTTYLDLVLLHRQDYLTDFAEVSALFYSWRAAGKVRYFGTSNYDQNTFLNLHSHIPLVTNEVEVSVWAPETICPNSAGRISTDTYFTNDGLVDFHYRLNMSVLGWGSLGGDPYGGANRLFDLSGNRQSQVRAVLQSMGSSLGDLEDVVALAWVLKHPSNIVPLIGTMNAQRMTNQTRALALAQKMSRSNWYTIARVIGVPMP